MLQGFSVYEAKDVKKKITFSFFMCAIPGAHSEEPAYGSSKLLPAVLLRSEEWHRDVPITELRM